ncbi:MAG: hypothetical protein WCI73_20150, partial [Phycisphaerae bacterium]
MTLLEQLLDFFRREFAAEENHGFPRLSRIPDSDVAVRLAYYRSLDARDKHLFRDFCAHWAVATYGSIVG